MSCPTVDQASKQNFVVNIQDSEFGKLVVWWRERDIIIEDYLCFFMYHSGLAVRPVPYKFNKLKNLWIPPFRAKSPQDIYVWQDSAKNSGSGHLPNYWLSVFSGFTAGFYMNANGIILARKVRPYNNPFIKWNDDWHHIFETKRLKRLSISKAAQSIANWRGVSLYQQLCFFDHVSCILGSSTTFLKL